MVEVSLARAHGPHGLASYQGDRVGFVGCAATSGPAMGDAASLMRKSVKVTCAVTSTSGSPLPQLTSARALVPAVTDGRG